MTNRFAYRLPHDKEIHRGESSRLVHGIGAEGFVVAPFDDAANKCFTIPVNDDTVSEVFVPEEYTPPTQSTSPGQHACGVNMILGSIASGELNKCVLSKVVVRQVDIDIDRTFNNLCESRPDAFVFYFETPETGAWIGATPEILMFKGNRTIATMSLAGTRIADSQGEWDVKDLNEQRIVTDFIVDTMSEAGYPVGAEGPMTHKAGNVEHLLTRIITASRSEADDIRLLYELSPTPALCGLPRDAARKILGVAEQFDRGYYGGFCGPINSDGSDMKLFVNLRSCCIKDGRCCIYAGGGIVEGSEPESEWAETERKAETIKHNLIKNKITT